MSFLALLHSRRFAGPVSGLGRADAARDPQPRAERRSLLQALALSFTIRVWTVWQILKFPWGGSAQILTRHQGNEVAYCEKSTTLWRKEMNNCKRDICISDINRDNWGGVISSCVKMTTKAMNQSSGWTISVCLKKATDGSVHPFCSWLAPPPPFTCRPRWLCQSRECWNFVTRAYHQNPCFLTESFHSLGQIA